MKASFNIKKSNQFLSRLIIPFSHLVAFGQNVATWQSALPAAFVAQKIGISEISVNYDRPRVKLNGADRFGKH